jgi:4-coumarate--CoA ligase
MAKFEIESFCATIQNHKCSFVYVVPPVVLLLSKHPAVSKYDLSSVRMLNSGAAPLTKDLVDAVYARLNIPVKQGYGLSETSPTTHTQPWELWNKPVGSIGRLFPNMRAKYMSEAEEELAPGETGELWLQGPNIFQGYHKNTEATANALTSDRWFKTGDVGHVDKEGNFYITERVKELIKYKGFQVAPAELEGTLIGHPKINDCAVIGVYNADIASEVPRAYIVPAPGVAKDKAVEQEILKWFEGKVSGNKKLRGGIRWVDEIPKTASGKILRRVLKEKAKEEAANGEKARL